MRAAPEAISAIMPILVVFTQLVSNCSGRILVKRQASLATEDGVDVPITLRSLITCLVPGIRENICLGPRVQLLKRERIGLTDRQGAAYGYHNGVDVRLLRRYNVPLIQEQTEIGRSYGAVVDATPTDGALDVGVRDKIFKLWNLNRGAVVQWDPWGAGADVGARAAVADDLIKLKYTAFGVDVGPTTGTRNLIGPYKTGRTKGQDLKVYTPLQSYYPGYYYGTRGDWYRNQFVRPGDEFKTKEQRACPWCVAVDPTFPTQSIFSG